MIVTCRQHWKSIALIFVASIFIFAIRYFHNEQLFSIQGYKLPGNTGRVEGTRRISQEDSDKSGALSYGPYVKLAPGKYRIKLKYSTSSDQSGLWDIIYQGASKVTKSGNLQVKNNGILMQYFDVSNELSDKAWEIRVWYTGKGLLEVKGIEITKVQGYAVLLSIIEGTVSAIFISFLVIILLPHIKYGSQIVVSDENKIKNLIIILLFVICLILLYPFDFGKGVFQIFFDLWIIYLYLVFIGLGSYFLLTPDWLRKYPMIFFLTAGCGLLLLSVVNVYVINFNENVIYSLYASIIIGTGTLCVSFFFKYKAIVSELNSFKQYITIEMFKSILIISLFILVILSPVIKSGNPTTPYRLGPDQAGYAVTAQYLLNGGTLDQVKKDIMFQVGTDNLSTAVSNNFNSLRFDTAIYTDQLLKAYRQSYSAIIAVFTIITGSSHSFNVQFIALILNYMILLGFFYFFVQHMLRLSNSTSLFLSLALGLNCNLLNAYYEGFNAQIFFMPFIFLLLVSLFCMRKYWNLNKQQSSEVEHVARHILFTALTFAGMLSIYNEGLFVYFAVILLCILFDVIFNRSNILRSLVYLTLSLIIGFLLVFPQSFNWLMYIFGRDFKYSLSSGGFPQPHWASPPEILGMLNMYSSAYTLNSPRLFERGEMDFFLNLNLSLMVIIFIGYYFFKKRDIDKSFWLSIISLTVLMFIKLIYFDQSHNYYYMKMYTTLSPFILTLTFLAVDFFSKNINPLKSRLLSIVKYSIVLSIIVSGVLYIKQYNQESKIITDDMFRLYEFNKQNNNIFASYVLLTNKGRIEEFMLAPLIPFNWLNQGVYKNPVPHLEKKIAIFIQKKDLPDLTILDKYRRNNNILYENHTLLVLNTNMVLKESYDPKNKKSDASYFTTKYKDLF